VVGSVLLYGLATIGFGLAQNAVTCFIALGLVGFADTVSTVLRNTWVQLETPDHLRGRVTAIATIFSKSGPRLGQVEAGLVASYFGLTASIVSGGAFCCVAGLVVAAINSPLRNLVRMDHAQK
jgi:MFS family permease